jgi:hypothetical protein
MQDKGAYGVHVAAARASCSGRRRNEKCALANVSSATRGMPRMSQASRARAVHGGATKRATDFRAILTKLKKGAPDVVLYGHPQQSVLDIVRM